MNVNKRMSISPYKRNLSITFALQYSLTTAMLLCMTSVFLYGAYNLFNRDFAYLGSIALLILLTFFRKKGGSTIYWFIRPKINHLLFSNLHNLTILLWCILYSIIWSIENKNISTEALFGMTGSILFMLALPITFYVWLIFTRMDEKAKLQIVSIKGFSTFKEFEIYLTIILIALFGFIYDYIPQSLDTVLLLPIILAIALLILSFLVNQRTIHYLKAYLKNSTLKAETKTEESSLINLYEKRPYELLSVIDESFPTKSEEEQEYILHTLKRISAIDSIDALKAHEKSYDQNHKVYRSYQNVLTYLEKVNEKVKQIDNAYDFIEQSNDLVTIKGLIRSQSHSPDKNLIIKLLNDNRVSIKKSACIVAGYQNDINIISILIETLGKPALSIWAQLALENIGSRAVKYIEIELSKRKSDLLFVESCVDLLCRINSEPAQQILFKTLDETNSNVRKIAAKKIIIYGIRPSLADRHNFTKLFDELIITILSNEYLLKEMGFKNENFKQLKNAIDNENKESMFLILNMIKFYYNPLATHLIFGNYGKSHPASHACSNFLIDLIINDDVSIQNRIKLLFSPEERTLLELLQEEFPEANVNSHYESEEDLIWSILKKEYDQINSWTRACALNLLNYTYKEDIPFELAAEFLNENKLLQETAADIVYQNLPEFYTIFLSRLQTDEAAKLDYLIRSNYDVMNKGQVRKNNLMLYDKIKFLSSIPYLNYLSISEIINFHLYFKTKVLKAGEHQINLTNDENLGFWIVEHGTASYSKDGIQFANYSRRDIIKISNHDAPADHVFFYLEEDVRFLIVEDVILLNIIKDYEEIIKDYIDTLPTNINLNNEDKLNQKAA